MAEYLGVLESLVDGDSDDGKEAAIVGYTLSLLSAVFNNSKKDCNHVFTYFQKLQRKASTYDKEELTTLEAQCFCFSLACLTKALYNAKWIGTDEVDKVHQILKNNVEKTPQVS